MSTAFLFRDTRIATWRTDGQADGTLNAEPMGGPCINVAVFSRPY